VNNWIQDEVRWEWASFATGFEMRAEVRGEEMDESKRRAAQFLEKEIKTYTALALFLSKEGIKERVLVGHKVIQIGPTYYKERMREARKIVNELRKPN
jgi:hypothetical protein